MKRFLVNFAPFVIGLTVVASLGFGLAEAQRARIFSRVAASPPPAPSDILSESRRTDWTQAGAADINEPRAACYTDVTTKDTLSEFSTQVANVAADCAAVLQSGTYNWNLLVNVTRSDVTIRGQGADQTRIVFTDTDVPSVRCHGKGSGFCVNPSGYMELNTLTPTNATDWTAHFDKGDERITLKSVTGLNADDMIVLYQNNAAADPGVGMEWTCSESDNDFGADECAYGASGGGGCPWNGGQGITCNPAREQLHFARVTQIDGTDVTISPPLIANNWSASLSPKAAYLTQAPISGVGIEDLTIDMSSCTLCEGVVWFWTRNSWLKGVKIIMPGRNHVQCYGCLQVSVVDNYFYEGQSHQDQSYGVECLMGTSLLIQNNIANNVTTPWMLAGSCSGSVVAYNYSKDLTYSAGWQMDDSYHHGAGTTHVLWEGNIILGLIAENIHGPASHITAFRNYIRGRDWDDNCGGSACSAHTNTIALYSYSRFWNVIGNVLGDNGYHDDYENFSTSTTSTDPTRCYTAIYQLGFGNNQCTHYIGEDAYLGVIVLNDTSVRTTLMRWGNYDTFHDAPQWEESEVPSDITGSYDNPVPATQDLPNSMYLPNNGASKPAWVGVSTPWPFIGPDVEGGDIAGLDGHAYSSPAKLCHDTGTFSGAEMTDFSRSRCYP